MSTPVLGSAGASPETHDAFHRATRSIFERRQRERAAPGEADASPEAPMDTRSAGDEPSEAAGGGPGAAGDDDIHFDYELRDPLSAFALWFAAAFALLILAGAVLLLLG